MNINGCSKHFLSDFCGFSLIFELLLLRLSKLGVFLSLLFEYDGGAFEHFGCWGD